MMRLYYCYHFIQEFVCGITVEDAKNMTKEHLESIEPKNFTVLDKEPGFRACIRANELAYDYYNFLFGT
jgi:hypothetical protein